MPQYMIELSHSPSDCVDALRDIDPDAQEFLGDVYWGCMTGRHDGWAVVEADSEQQARDMVPDTIRNQIQVTQVENIVPEIEHGVDPEAKNPGSMEPSGS